MRNSKRSPFFQYDESVKYAIWFAGLLFCVLMLIVPIREMIAMSRIKEWPGKVWEKAWDEADSIEDLEANWDVVRRDLRRQGVDISWGDMERAIAKTKIGNTIYSNMILSSLQTSRTTGEVIWLVLLRLALAVLFLVFVLIPPNELLFITRGGFKFGIGALGFCFPPAALVLLFILLIIEGYLSTWRRWAVFLAGVLAALALFGVFVP